MNAFQNYPSWDEASSKYKSLEDILSEDSITMNIDWLKLIFSCIDLTSLDVSDTQEKIRNMCVKVNELSTKYPDFSNVASVCVYPALVDTVKSSLKLKSVGITSVAGGFPSSQTAIEVKELETEIALLDGATEIDIVISLGKFFAGKYNIVGGEISDIKTLLKKKNHLKVILESGLHPSLESVYQASLLAMESGADFVKTSTGKTSPAATPEAMYAMSIAVSEFYKKNNIKIGLKPAGGIAQVEETIPYLKIIHSILGEDWLNPKLFRFGASRLANNVLEAYQKAKGESFEPYF